MPKITRTQPTTAKTKPKKGGSVLERITGIDFDDSDGISMLVYGASGTGKTTFAGTFPGFILWIVVSGGNKPGELRSLNTPAMRKKIKKVELESSDDFRALIEYQKESGEYTTLVNDHVSGLQDLVMSEILGKPVAAQKSWGDATQQQYGKCSMIVKDIMRDFLGLSCNRVILGQERSFEAKEDNDLVQPNIGVAVSPSIAGWLYPAVDYVCQTFKKQKTEKITVKLGKTEVEQEQAVKGVDYCLRTGPHSVYTTKFRIPKEYEKPDYITNPDYKQTMTIINGEWKN
jgi:hypothetical protein